ncbi:DUF2059 domain-containing protein [Duganella phyllosphaerae]|uniref:DUF2059 domain-containing protein n=1 Tax=Duganella phyllosphaerae TaxID=762836 RepID=A0A1E7WIB3_9BURK|nr:DUF2059 domain-containing protein [Duganella phyllosphaerae]OEZ98234.1 hypothetical protein DUPY_31790 [Duganella phyllosphaerae]
MKKIVAILAASTTLALSGAAAAQAPVAAPVAAAAAAPAALDPAALKAARELFDSMNYRQSMQEMMRQMSQSAMQSMRPMMEAATSQDKRLSEAQRKQMLDKIDAKMPQLNQMMMESMGDPALVDELLAQAIPIYARNFTVDELHQLAAFYATPVGKKMMAVMPKLASESMASSQQLMAQRMQPMMARLLTILQD